jgi:anti-sigma factor RsiW
MSKILHRARFRVDHRWTPGHMSAYLDGDLASRARARVERHTSECPECRDVLNGLRRMLGLLRGLPAASTRTRAAGIASSVRRRLHESPRD